MAAADRWNSKTLPKLPKRPAEVDVTVYQDAYFARQEAHGRLMEVEDAEREVAKLRREANAAAKHYIDLLEQVNGQMTIEEA